MENQLRELLMEDERLLWSGRPEAFDTLDKTNKPGIIAGLVIKSIVILGILWIYLYSARDRGVSPVGLGFILALSAVALAYPFTPPGICAKTRSTA